MLEDEPFLLIIRRASHFYVFSHLKKIKNEQEELALTCQRPGGQITFFWFCIFEAAPISLKLFGLMPNPEIYYCLIRTYSHASLSCQQPTFLGIHFCLSPPLFLFYTQETRRIPVEKGVDVTNKPEANETRIRRGTHRKGVGILSFPWGDGKWRHQPGSKTTKWAMATSRKRRPRLVGPSGESDHE
jgi:hypothetical protein